VIIWKSSIFRPLTTMLPDQGFKQFSIQLRWPLLSYEQNGGGCVD
jgi:hypothetical protein